jgi:hypothetical protein
MGDLMVGAKGFRPLLVVIGTLNDHLLAQDRWRSAVITRGGSTISWDPKQGVQSGSSKEKRGYERPDESIPPP